VYRKAKQTLTSENAPASTDKETPTMTISTAPVAIIAPAIAAAIAATVSPESLPVGLTPVLVTLTATPGGTLTARAEPVDPDVWEHGVETVLRGFAIGFRGKTWMFDDVAGYALVVPEHPAVYTVDRHGGWHVTPMPGTTGALAYDPARYSAAWWGLSAMIAAATGTPEPTGLPATPPAYATPLLIGGSARMRATVARVAADTGTRLDTATTGDDARAAWQTAPFVLVAASAAASVTRAGLPHRRNVIIVADESAKPDRVWPAAETLRADYVAMLPTARTWLADRFANVTNGGR
jgi:hypothetical protein